MEEKILLMSIILILFMFLAILFFVVKERIKENRLINGYDRIRPGMTKKQVISLLGDKYTKSYLRNGIEKLEWKYRKSGSTAWVSKGFYLHTNSLTRKISVKFINNRVVEINALNMD